MHEFKLIQEAIQIEQHHIPKLAQTRWLSRGQVVACIVEQWDALLLFFQAQTSSDRVDGAAQIHKTMTTPGTKHMFLFLNFLLPKIDRMNKEFQSESFRTHVTFSSIHDSYREILSLFILPEVIERCDLSEVDPKNPEIQLPLMKIHVGGRCTTLLEKEPLKEKTVVQRGLLGISAGAHSADEETVRPFRKQRSCPLIMS